MARTPTSKPEPRYRRHPDIVSRAVGDETILLPVRNNIVEVQSLYTLNETGAFVWHCLRAPATVAAIARALAEEFQVSVSRARVDVRKLVSRLVREGCAHEWDGETGRATAR